MRAELERIRKWADDKLAAGQEPPWAWFQYMKLRETLDQILAGMDATKLRLVEPNDQQDGVRRQSLPIILPM